MAAVREEKEAGEICRRVGHRKGIRVIPISPRRRMKRKTITKYCNCVLQYPSLVESEHDFMSSIPTHAVFLFLNPLMVDLLQVEYQNKDKSPFEARAANMWIFFAATVIHCLGLAFEMKFKNSSALRCQVFSNFVLFSGALSSVSLASVFLPRLPRWICLGLWTILPFLPGLPLLVSVLKFLSLKIGEAMATSCNRSVEFMKCIRAQMGSLPK